MLPAEDHGVERVASPGSYLDMMTRWLGQRLEASAAGREPVLSSLQQTCRPFPCKWTLGKPGWQEWVWPTLPAAHPHTRLP